MALETILAERDYEPLSPCCTLPDAARRDGLDLIDKAKSLQSTFGGSFTTRLRRELAEDQLAEIEALARRIRQSLRREK